jgi:hypothetical protein
MRGASVPRRFLTAREKSDERSRTSTTKLQRLSYRRCNLMYSQRVRSETRKFSGREKKKKAKDQLPCFSFRRKTLFCYGDLYSTRKYAHQRMVML